MAAGGGEREGRYYLDCCGAADDRGRGRIGAGAEGVGVPTAQAAVLLRPATVGQIADISRGGVRMPPKTTFFYPKPATGLVFRSLDLDAD